MKSKIQYLLPIVLTIFFFACKPKEIYLKDNSTVEYIQRFVPVYIPPDSATARALLECNDDGVVLLTRLQIETSRNANLALILDSLGNLDVKTTVRRDTLYIPSDSVIITRDLLRTEIEYRDRPITGWQRLKQELGGLAIGASLLLAAILLIRFFRKP